MDRPSALKLIYWELVSKLGQFWIKIDQLALDEFGIDPLFPWLHKQGINGAFIKHNLPYYDSASDFKHIFANLPGWE